MGEKSCEQSYNFNFKDLDRDGCSDAYKICDKPQASGERLRRVQNYEICLKILFELPGLYPSPTHRTWFVTEPLRGFEGCVHHGCPLYSAVKWLLPNMSQQLRLSTEQHTRRMSAINHQKGSWTLPVGHWTVLMEHENQKTKYKWQAHSFTTIIISNYVK